MARRFAPLLTLIAWALVWEVVAQSVEISVLPPLSSVLVGVTEVVQLKSFRLALLETGRAFGIGMALSVVVGVPLGVLMGVFRPADRLLNVWANVFISAPLTAVVPALMPLLGIGQTTVIATVFLFAVWVIVLDAREGVRKVNPSLIDMARTHHASRLAIFTKILVPGALPEVLTGIRLAVVRGVKGVIIGQIVIALVGFGALFDLYLQTFSMERFWALVIIIFVLAFLLVEGVGLIERRVAFYAKSR
ncbi:ABC transporter permease [Acuticoccus mangrovi]|uniref:ABC transporter permease subunit n=1 Tax=Acuticoccus mangrovi TaxID=2796142 RepID=A0A934ILE0_9HYPH|nr:ABC transporter permease subunit [Acuticoccus mangrovi]MBJ3774770.1 ABC transporter permease subunit [Acuticoccus mangrovi]